MEVIPILKQFGLSEKEIIIYLCLLETGPHSVRNLAEKTKINRGTTYDILKSLIDLGLVGYYHKATKQYFIAEDPAKLNNAIDQKLQNLNEVKERINQVIPSLKSLYDQAGEKPVVKYYEGHQGIKTIFNDVLETVDQLSSKEYLVFSTSTIKDHLYKAFPNFTKQRISKKIRVKVIAVGHGGTTAELAEVKSLSPREGSPTYIIVYHDKVVMISLSSKDEPRGIIIEDPALAATQRQLFEYIWRNIR
ncbi:MAG: transcriptional regulator [Candidatus Buchananbacteria bacterium CG10_big_fil_rev_8_21_14_0_10_42_9]|uniref:Transcriptional regulator n=1 Tax=Candidatus Buchananbacteria bacterium CG10_big_fil_rev_8_21_14_0_10_42_9 TaxID=1974526 RepID=A0A2H0W1B8_9BACT|nr:MAG: transcriptional regulator [Candidatus Buchananbacteria bacterium CG10_big_fil_rev_8_21_14_0_10_42_9]